jgi:hypothetical protein
VHAYVLRSSLCSAYAKSKKIQHHTFSYDSSVHQDEETVSRTGLPDGIFSNQKYVPIWVISGGPLEWKMLVYFMPIRNTLLLFYIFYGNLVEIWHNFPRFGILCQEKSGNPCQL